MTYKILHFADLHLDASFAGQGFPVEYGIERRLDLRATLTRILARARELKVDAVTIGGDFFVQEYLLPETADFVIQQLALLNPIRVIISPGEKDPYTNESPYARLNWPDNVDIFYQSRLTRLELSDHIHIWGACNPPARGQNLFEGIQLAKGTNILLLHAQRSRNNSDVLAISNETVQQAGFRFAILGGEHLSETFPADRPLCMFPGSPEPLTSTEEKGLHQIARVEIDGERIHIQPISLQQWHYRTIHVDLTQCTSMAEAARRIDVAIEAEIGKTPQSAVTVALSGQPKIDLSMADLRKLIQTPVFFRLESHFTSRYDLEQMAREQTVRGLLVQRFLARIDKAPNESERRKQRTALHLALQALDGKQVSLYETEEN